MMNKNDILEYFFGDIVRNLIRKNQTYLLIIPVIVIFWAWIYFFILRNHIKGTKYSAREKMYLFLAIFWTLIMIAGQILFLVRHPAN